MLLSLGEGRQSREAAIHAEAFPRSHHADALLQVDIPCSCYSSLLAILDSKIVQGLESVRIVCEPATIPCLSFSMNSMPPHSKIVQELGIVCEPATICLSF